MDEQPPRKNHETPDRRASDAVTWPVRVAAAWTWRLLVIGVGLYVLVRIFGRVELVAFSFILSLFFTSVLHPLEKRLRRIPGPRSLSAFLAMIIGLAVLGGIGYFVASQISDHSAQLGDQLSNVVDKTQNFLRNGPLHLRSTDFNKVSDSLTNTIKSHSTEIISGAVQTVATVVELVGALLLIILSTFFLLRDGELIWSWVLRLLPRRAQTDVDAAGRAGWHSLGGYIRGQALIAVFHGVAITILLFILNVPLAAALGVMIFIGSFIPILGLLVAGTLCTLVALLEHGLTSAIVVAVAITILVQLESHVLQPLIMSRSVSIHPLAVALSVLTGTVLAGIVGALLAVPLVAFLNTTILTLRHAHHPEPRKPGFGSRRKAEQPRGDPPDRTVAED